MKKKYFSPLLEIQGLEDILYSSDENIGDGGEFGDWDEDMPDDEFNMEEDFVF